MAASLNTGKEEQIMFPAIPEQKTENYNETVLIPLLEKRVHSLTSAVILAEAKLEIALKEKAELQKQLDAAKASQEAIKASDTIEATN
jgi:hypothetical protein